MSCLGGTKLSIETAQWGNLGGVHVIQYKLLLLTKLQFTETTQTLGLMNIVKSIVHNRPEFREPNTHYILQLDSRFLSYSKQMHS